MAALLFSLGLLGSQGVDDFKAAMKDARTVVDKARALLLLGDAEERDASLVPHAARFLAPAAGDVHICFPSRRRRSWPASAASRRRRRR